MTEKCILDGIEEEYHDGTVISWTYDTNSVYDTGRPDEYQCRRCKEIRKEQFPYKQYMTMIEHNATCDGTCDMCESRKIMINSGDANSSRGMTNKKWEGELNAYYEARAQGIQPAGTSMAAIKEAHRASEALGAAYDADSMPATQAITKETVSILKETGEV